MLDQVTVLLTGAGAPGAPGIIKCLRKNGERDIRIVGVDMNENAGARDLVDVFYTVPAASDTEFIPSILNICKCEKVDIIEPIVTRELMLFAVNKEKFDCLGHKVLVMPPSTLNIVNNKAHLLTAIREKDIPTPEFYVVHNLNEIISAVKRIGYPSVPFCIKGAEGNGSRGVRIIDSSVSKYDLFFNSKPNSLYISYDELINTLSEKDSIPEMLVMEYLPGQEYGVDVLCDNGSVLVEVGRYNYSVNSSIPQGCIIETRPEAMEQARIICKKLCVDGHANFDFKYNANNEIRLIEINPRLSATIVAYAAAGVNLPYLGIKRILGEPLPSCKAVSGTRMIRRYEEQFLSPEGKKIEW